MQLLSLKDSFPRIYRPSVEEVLAIGEDIPFVITGIVPEWDGFNKWTTTYLAEKYGNLLVPVRDNRKHIYKTPSQRKNNPPEKMTFGHYIETIIEKDSFEADNYYMVEQNPNFFPGLSNDFRVPDYIKDRDMIIGFWLSRKGAFTKLHYDLGHNFLAQVAGQKRLIIYRPNLTCLYPYPKNGLSQVNIENPDYEQYPNFKYTQPHVCMLKAGEILYLPSCWWHQVYSEEKVNISINFFWKPSIKYTINHLHPLMRPKIIKLNDAFLTLKKWLRIFN